VVSEELEQSLRSEIERYVEQRLSDIKQEIAQLQSQVNESFKRLLETESAVAWDGSFAAAVGEHLRAAHERGIEFAASESSRAQASSDMALVKSAIEEIATQNSQSEILKALVNRASSFAPHVAFFAVKGDQARGWRARGFQGSIGDEVIQQISVPLAADTVIGEVIRSRSTWSGTPGSHSEDHQLLSRLGEEAPQRIVAVPLVVRGRAVAALYVDSAALDSDAINLEALETLVRVTAMAVALLSVSQGAAAKAQAEPAPQRVEEPTAQRVEEPATGYTPAREYAEPSREYVEPAREPAEPEPTGIAAEPETASAAVEPPREYGEPVPASTEPEHATIASEPETSPTTTAAEPEMAPPEQVIHEPSTEPQPVPFTTEPATAPLLSELPRASEAAAPVRRRYGLSDVDLPVAISDEEEKRQHADARRFARLLVSEIKLYNEQKVLDGRSNNDLYQRLQEYIDRSREMYDKRVKPEVSEKYDYFHHELVNTLAQGDPSKLGAAYPGTAVPAV
jgi:hypothetical protein